MIDNTLGCEPEVRASIEDAYKDVSTIVVKTCQMDNKKLRELALRGKIHFKCFSSCELKAQVNFSVCLLYIRLSVNFSHFHLLLKTHGASFNQTWLKAFLGEGGSTVFK